MTTQSCPTAQIVRSTATPTQTAAALSKSKRACAAHIADANNIRLGGGFRLPTARLGQVADAGKIRLGGGFRLPATRPAQVADAGKIRLGGGFRLPTVITRS